MFAQTYQEENITPATLYADDLERSEDMKLRDKIAALVVKQAQAGLKYKENRVKEWNENINLYANVKSAEVGDGRFDYPLPVMSGFIDTSMSNIKDEPVLEFDHVSFADKKRAKKVTAAWQFYSSPSQMDWATVDLDVKKIAHFTGIGIYKTYFESDPEFKGYLEAVDPFDYIPEPLGVGDLWKHKCGFQDNIFRSKWELEAGKHYNEAQVKKLIAVCGDKDAKLNKMEHRAKLNRFMAMGLKYDAYVDYESGSNYRLTEGFTTYEGKLWYVFMDLQTGIWVRIEPLKEVFKSNKPMFVGWQTHRDAFNFLSKAPADDIRPIAYAMKRVFNEAMYNINKRNSGSRAYDPEIFEEPDLLQWRPDGLTPATVPAGKSISNGIYEFKTEDNTAITVNLINFLDNFVGQKTGITPSTQGQSQSDIKVGVYFGDLQRVAARFGLTNKYYAKAWHDLGYLFSWGLWEHMGEKLLVKVIGEDGNGWQEEITKDDAAPDFSVIVRGGSADLQADELKKKTKNDSLQNMANSPLYGRLLNPRLVVEESLRNGGWEEEAIKRFMDLNSLGDEDSLINAAQAIQDVLEGKEPRIYRKATLAFLSKIEDFLAGKEIELDKEVKMFAYFNKMQPIVARNMARRAKFGGPTMVLPGMFPQAQPQPGMDPMKPGGSPSDRSNDITRVLNANPNPTQ